MEQKQRQERLVASYWVRDPVRWANTYIAQADEFANAGITIARTRVKAHPRRNPDFPYKISLTLKIAPARRDAAILLLEGGRALMKQGGVDAGSIVNDWYS